MKYSAEIYSIDLQDSKHEAEYAKHKSKSNKDGIPDSSKKKQGRPKSNKGELTDEIFSHPIGEFSDFLIHTTASTKAITKWNNGLDEKLKVKSLEVLLKDYSNCIDFQTVSNYLVRNFEVSSEQCCSIKTLFCRPCGI